MRTSATQMQQDRVWVFPRIGSACNYGRRSQKIIFQVLYKRLAEWMDCIVSGQGIATFSCWCYYYEEEKPCQGETQITKRNAYPNVRRRHRLWRLFFFLFFFLKKGAWARSINRRSIAKLFLRNILFLSFSFLGSLFLACIYYLLLFF